MPLQIHLNRKYIVERSKVTSVDLHPKKEWMLTTLHNGEVNIWNTGDVDGSELLVKSLKVCDLPVQSAKFIPRENWIVTVSDDLLVNVFNYNTLERVHHFEAHAETIRCIVVHPKQPFILTCSDDLLIKLFNWQKQWNCTKVFMGHFDYITQIVFNPNDENTFASASLDQTVKIWHLGSSSPNITLDGHEKGVLCVDYYHDADKPYLICGAGDKLKIWDYMREVCMKTLLHSHIVSSVAVHPNLPIFLTGSEDGILSIWNSKNIHLKNRFSTADVAFGSVSAISCLEGCTSIAVGYAKGSSFIKLSHDNLNEDETVQNILGSFNESHQIVPRSIPVTKHTAWLSILSTIERNKEYSLKRSTHISDVLKALQKLRKVQYKF